MFNYNALSTLDTLAQHEKEINEQAGYTQRWGIMGETIDDDTDIKVSLPIGSVSVVYELANGLKVSDSTVTLEVWTVPMAKIMTFTALDSSENPIDTFLLNEASGLILHGASGRIAYLTHEQAWQLFEVNRTWQDKIDLAKELLINAIESALFERGYRTNELGGTPLISIVTNAETFRIACDYLTLSLIYRDLSNGGFDELFRRKAELYGNLYDNDLAMAMNRMQLDPNLTGAATESRPNMLGRIQR